MSVKVSILVPVYNSARFIQQMFDLVLAQTFQEYELILIADPCTDNSLEIIKNNESSKIILITTKERLGLPASLNLGLQRSSGKYIFRLDTDDYLAPDCLQKLFNFLETSDYDGVTCDEQKVDENNKPKYMLLKLLDDYYIKKQNLFRTAFAGPTTMLKKEKLLSAGGWDSRMNISDDRRLALKLHKLTKIGHIPERLYYYREHGGNMSKGIALQKSSRKYKDIMREYLAVFTKEDYINLPEKISEFKQLKSDYKEVRLQKYANVILRCAIQLAKLGEKAAALTEIEKAIDLYPKLNYQIFGIFIKMGFMNYLDKLYVNMNVWTGYAYDDFRLV